MDGMENLQNQEVAPETAPAPEPVDMAQAFKMLNEIERKRAEEPVATPAPDQPGEPADEPAGNAEPESQGGAVDVGVPAPVDTGSSADDGGSPVGIDAIDFNSRKQSILQDIQRQSINLVRNEFKEQGIDYYNINELTVRDENTGQVRFRNPDVGKNDTRNPDYYFKSRADAMAFIDAWNKGVDNEWRKAVNEKQKTLLSNTAPVIRLIDFAPTYFAMDKTTQNVFEQLIAPYAIRDRNGKEIGYNVNLDAVASQARAIAGQFAKPQQQQQQHQQQQQQPAKQGTGPAMDMKTGNSLGATEAEPKTLGEALKMIDKRNRSKKNG